MLLDLECILEYLTNCYYISQGSIGIPCMLDVTAKLGVDSGTLDHSEQNWRRVEFFPLAGIQFYDHAHFLYFC